MQRLDRKVRFQAELLDVVSSKDETEIMVLTETAKIG